MGRVGGSELDNGGIVTSSITRIAATTTTVALMASVATVAAPAASADSRTLITASCKRSDGTGQGACWWDGRKRGGRSFVSFDRGSRIIYIKQPKSAVTNKSPLVYIVKGDTGKIWHGRTVLATVKHKRIVWV